MIKLLLTHKYLIIIILIGLILRTWNLANLPAGFTADEASHGYDAYSLIQTGKDQFGQPWPIAFRSFGDFKLPIYTYLAIPFVAIGGLNEFTVRLPGALIGTLAIIATYLLTKELFKNNKLPITNHQLPILAALLIAISPWHIQLSRGAVEANLTSFFVPLALWTWLKGFQKPHPGPPLIGEGIIPPPFRRGLGEGHLWWFITAILLGINLYTYHAARAFTILLIPLLAWITWIRIQNNKKSVILNLFQNPYHLIKSLLEKENVILQLIKINILPIIVFTVFLIPMGISLISGGSSRGLDVAIFNPTDNWRALSNLRHETVLNGLPDPIARLTTNKLTYSLKEFSKNYLTYLSPHFLFIQGPGEATYGMFPGRGVLHWFELPLILFAIYYAIRKPSKPLTFLLAILLLAPIPAALSKGAGLAANRATPMLPFIHILTAYGLAILINKLNKLNKPIEILSFLFLCFNVFMFFCFFVKDYLIHAPKLQAKAMSYGWQEAVPQINQIKDQYDHIIISRKFNEPHIFLMFYTPIDPNYIQQLSLNWLEYEKQNLNFIDQLGEYHLNKFTFLEIQTEHLQQPNTLIVARPEDFHTPKPTILEINRPSYPQLTPAIIFLDTNNL